MIEIIRILQDEDDQEELQALADYLVNLIINSSLIPRQ